MLMNPVMRLINLFHCHFIFIVIVIDDATFYCNLGDISEDIINTELTKVSEWLVSCQQIVFER